MDYGVSTDASLASAATQGYIVSTRVIQHDTSTPLAIPVARFVSCRPFAPPASAAAYFEQSLTMDDTYVDSFHTVRTGQGDTYHLELDQTCLGWSCS